MMARPALALLLAALAAMPAALASTTTGKPPVKPGVTPSYANFAAANLTGQFAINMFTRESDAMPWQPHTCNATTYGASCNQPVLYGGSTQAVRIVYSKRNMSEAVTTYKSGTPVEVIIRLDYAPPSQVDRGWRKKNQAYPGCGYHAKWEVATIPYSPSGEGIWYLEQADEVTDALLYPEICVLCSYPDGSTDYCQCDRRGPTGASLITVESEVVNSITPAMRAAAIALSIFSPMFLIVYAVGDSFYFKRTGRSLRIAHA